MTIRATLGPGLLGATLFICLLHAPTPHAGAHPASESTDSLAFPGAEGFGRHAVGGRGGRVIKVTHLGDDGKGSLRAALRAEGPRTVLFDVAGVIELERNIVLHNGRVTIAGQSAPGDGVTLKNFGLVVKADDVVIRYLRVRPGSEAGAETDAISVAEGHNIIIDHCSASWATDETLTVSPHDQGRPKSIDLVTVQWSIIAESLNDSVHSKGQHGYGSLVRGSAGARYSFHHNLWAHHKARMPRPGNYADAETDPAGPLFDFRNNLFYNWGGAASGYNADTDSIARYNFVDNYYLRGPNSSKALAFDEANPLAELHFSGNWMNGELPADPWNLVRFKTDRQGIRKQAFDAAPISGGPANEAYEQVLARSGASHHRDAADRRVIDTVRQLGGTLIDSEKEVGGWPEVEFAEARPDQDGDGMPDDWETANGLCPQKTDGHHDPDGDGYTNLEDYLNELVSDRTSGT
ncbi:MAG: pectate lyase [Xanthomonadales bacterium]|nr:pectate lyase [Gammaproteobacteria bacterium]NNL04327.1 pectate lyase [Xanthomonadales bacterium]